MKIAFLNENPILPYIGGIERVTKILSNEFIKRGHEVIFISIKDWEEFRDYIGIEEKQFFLPKDLNKREKKLIELIEKEKPDVIINQSFSHEAVKLLRLIKGNDIRKVSVYHNMPFAFYGKERKIKKLTPVKTFKGKIFKTIGIFFPGIYRKGRMTANKRLVNDILEVSDKFFMLSERFVVRVRNLMPDADLRKLDYINNPNTFPIDESNILGKENLVIFVGRLEDPQKNVRGFIDAWMEFHKTHKEWKALIIGDGPHRNIFERYANKKDVSSLEFIGNKKNIAQFYKRAKILCMPSTYEGWGMVLTEAIANECVPVVFDSFESVYDIIENGKTGFIVPSFNAQSMGAKMGILADNEAKRERMGKLGKMKIKMYEASNITDIWINKLQEKTF